MNKKIGSKEPHNINSKSKMYENLQNRQRRLPYESVVAQLVG